MLMTHHYQYFQLYRDDHAKALKTYLWILGTGIFHSYHSVKYGSNTNFTLYLSPLTATIIILRMVI